MLNLKCRVGIWINTPFSVFGIFHESFFYFSIKFSVVFLFLAVRGFICWWKILWYLKNPQKIPRLMLILFNPNNTFYANVQREILATRFEPSCILVQVHNSFFLTLFLLLKIAQESQVPEAVELWYTLFQEFVVNEDG